MDPRAAEHADVLEAMDEHERLARLPRRVRVVGRATRLVFAVLGLGLVALLLLALAFSWGKGEVVAEVLTMLIAALLAIPGGLLTVRSLRGHWARTRALPHPGRWALALPAGKSDASTDGVVSCAAILRSPLAAEPCAGYEIGVRFDDDAEGPIGTWLLLEQRCADIEVAGTPIDGGEVHLRLPRQRLPSSIEADERVDHFLRERGIRPGRHALRIYETRLLVGDVVTARRSDNGVVTLSR